MHILLWGTFDDGKPRIRILRKGLRDAGALVNECHASIWTGIEDKSQIGGFLQKAWLLISWLVAYPRLLYRFLRCPRPDIVLVSYPGLIDVLLLWPFARIRGVPLVWDMFMSVYDTTVHDRQLLKAKGLLARALRRIEKLALRCASFVFLDTKAHARRIESLFRLEPNTCGAVWVGVEEDCFPPARREQTTSPNETSPLRVLFYGQFIPLHGVETIVAAARLTRDEPVLWQLVGRGQMATAIRTLIDQDPLPRLQWKEWIQYSQLQNEIAAADVCLGIFGVSQKAASVIPNKVFQIVASGQPLITRDSPAIRELVQHSPPCVYLTPQNDPEALADAIRQFARTAREQHPCHAVLRESITAAAIGRAFLVMVRQELQVTEES